MNDLRIQVQREGQEAVTAYEKFMCFCQNAEKDNGAAVEEQKERIERLSPQIEENAIALARLEDQVKQTDAELDEHKQAADEGKSIRKQEREKYEEEHAVLLKSIDGLGKAIQVLQRADAAGYQGALLQTTPLVRDSLKPFSQLPRVKNVLDDSDLQALLRGAFVQQGVGPDHVLGVLQGLLDGFVHDQQDMEQREQESQRNFDELSSSKQAEIRAAFESVRKLSEEKSSLAAQVARDRDDLASTQVSLHRDSGALADLEQECKDKDAAERERKQRDLEELTAINEAVTILSRDDDTFVFTKAAPSFLQLSQRGASFLQRGQAPTAHAALEQHQGLQVKAKATDVLQYLQELAKRSPMNKNLQLLATKLTSMSGQDFGRVIQVIGKQVEMADLEQKQDDEKYAWCKHEVSQNNEMMQVKHQEITDLTAQLGSADSDRKLLEDEVGTLQKEERELKDQLHTAQQNREEEQQTCDHTIVEVKTAQQALVKAIQVLEQVYGPALLQTKVGGGLEQEQQSASVDRSGGDRQGGGKAIVAMLAQIGEDLVAQESQLRAEEQKAQEAFVKFTSETDMSLKLKASQLVTRQSEIARLEQAGMQFGSDIDAANELVRTLEGRRDQLAGACGLLQTYEERKSLRAADKGAMLKAIEILS